MKTKNMVDDYVQPTPRPYIMDEEKSMILSEPAAAYGIAEADVDELDDEWDAAPDAIVPESEEWNRMVERCIDISLDQLEKGQWYTADEVWDRMYRRMGWK